jgi:hypothetical protein
MRPPRSKNMPEKSLLELLDSARKTLNIYTDGRYAQFLGVSRRTIQRHRSSDSVPSHGGAARLVRALFPADPATARLLAQAHQVDIRDLEPKPPSPVAARVPTVGPGHVAMLIMGVAEDLEKQVRETRGLLSTIFERALALGVDLNELAPLLIVKKEPEQKAAPA